MKFAISLQFLLPGIPLVYYGSEVGLTGADDPDCRRTMIWDKNRQNRDLYNYYKKIISYYNQNRDLRKGDYKELFMDPLNKILIFSRKNKKSNENSTVVIINMSDKKQNINDKNIIELLKNKNLSFSINNNNNNSFNNNCLKIDKKQILIYS
jgi:glycosidase